MPSHRAYFATAEQARTAASAAVDALTAKWGAAAIDAGAETESTTPVVGVRIVDSVVLPPLADTDAALVDTKITGAGGHTETARLAMTTTETDALLTPAYGTARLTSTLKCEATITARTAKSVLVEMLDATATALTGLIVQDSLTGKKYMCGVYNAAARGAHTVPVSQTDSTDASDVTFGSAMEFLAPPANAMPIARVNAMNGFTATSVLLTDAAGRSYTTESLTLADGTGLTGLHSGTIALVRTPNNDTDPALAADLTSLEVGAAVTWGGAPASFSATLTVTQKGELTVPADTPLTFTDGGAYKVSTDTLITDRLYTDATFIADVNGSASNRAPGDTLDLPSPPTNVGSTALVYTAVPAAVLPQRYASQLVGAPVTWSSRVSRATDGRWLASVFTLPEGS